MSSKKQSLDEMFSQAVANYTPTSIKDVVFEQVKSAIITGRLKPGERLVEHQLASKLNVSRTPLREALRLLEQELLVERLPRGGVRVTPISLEEMMNLNEARCVLEVYCVERAAANVAAGELDAAAKAHLEQLRLLPETMQQKLAADDVMDLLGLGGQFHEAIHALAGNPITADLLRQVIGAMERYRALVPPVRTATTVKEHTAIAEAVLAGDAERAGQLMRNHVVNAGEHYATTIRDNQERGIT